MFSWFVFNNNYYQIVVNYHWNLYSGYWWPSYCNDSDVCHCPMMMLLWRWWLLTLLPLLLLMKMMWIFCSCHQWKICLLYADAVVVVHCMMVHDCCYYCYLCDGFVSELGHYHHCRRHHCHRFQHHCPLWTFGTYSNVLVSYDAFWHVSSCDDHV